MFDVKKKTSNGFSLKLILNSGEDGILIVSFCKPKKKLQLYTNVLSFNHVKVLSKQLIQKNKKYFYKKKMLLVHDLSQSNLEKVVRELEESGDIFEVMEPLTKVKITNLKILLFLKKMKKSYLNRLMFRVF